MTTRVSVAVAWMFNYTIRNLRNAEQLMSLQAQTPLRMFETIAQRELRILFARGAVHRLKKKMLEVQIFVKLGFSATLREDQFQLMA